MRLDWKSIILLMLLFSLCLECSKQTGNKLEYLTPEKGNIAVVYGKKHVFAIFYPEGWILDKKIAKENSLGSFFYPKDAIDPKRIYMYAHGWDKLEGESLDDFIKEDIKTWKNEDPSLCVTKATTITTHDSSIAIVYEFKYRDGDVRKRIAYIDTPSAICVLVLYSNDKNEFVRYFESFSFLTKSFHYIGDDPEKAFKIHQEFIKKNK